MARGAPIPELSITRDHAIETVIAVAIFVGGLVLARIVQLLLRRIVHLFTRSSERQHDEWLSRPLRLPLALLFIATAALVALRTLSYLDPERATIERVWGALALGLLVWLVQRLTAALVFRSEALTSHPLRGVTPLARRGLNVAFFGIGGLLVLDQLGVSISPLLAGLGIGGLAVALALQPLLTNLFAGSYVMSDSSIRAGDFVTMQAGPAGTVIDIGWRATRLRDADSNIVIVPNATLAASIVTNHGQAGAEDVVVTYPIPYGRDLDHVELVAIEVLRAIAQERDEVIADARPVVRFVRFGEARIDCVCVLRAHSRSEVPLLRHLLMKRLHDRFQAEGFNPD